MIASLALTCAVAAGVVVDASASTEAHATEPGPTAQAAAGTVDAVDVGAGQDLSGTFVLRPGIAAAVSRGGIVGAVQYQPSVSLVSTAPTTPAILHTADARAELPFGPRFTLRSALNGSVGDLDPASAQSALANSATILSPTAVLSYANGTASAGATLRATRTVGFDVNVRAGATASPAGQSAQIPTAYSGGADASTSWQVSRLDALTFGAEARALAIDTRGVVTGIAPTLGYRRLLAANAGLEIKAGLGVAQLDARAAKDTNTITAAAIEANDGFYPLPIVDARVHGLFDFGGAAKLELTANGGVDLSSDPLGPLLEDRLSAGVGVGYRATRQVTFRIDTTGFYSLFSKDAPPPVVQDAQITQVTVADSVLNNRASIAWEFVDGASLSLEGLATSRLIDNFVSTDVSVGVILAGTYPLYHSGGRPAGTDQRVGRDIGVPPIGQPPPVGATTIREPEPLEIIDEPEPPPEALRPPPPNVPIAEQPLQVDTLKKFRDLDKKDADKKKKKKKLDKDGKPIDVDPLALPTAPTAEPASPPAGTPNP